MGKLVTATSLTLFIVCLLSSAIAAAELYRWVDDNGVVHYSDQKSSDSAIDYTPETELSTFENVYFQRQPKPDYSNLPPVDQRRASPDLAKLQAVKFPATPNDANVRVYVQKIYAISRNQKSHLTSDPQVSLLMQVGSEHLHVLIDETYSHVGWHNYGIEVIKRLATDQHKSRIIDTFKRYSKYASVIYAKDWHHEYQGLLIEGLRKNRHYVPSDWIKAVAEFDREDARQVLIEYFKYGWNNHITYKYIAGLSGIDAELAKAIPIAWSTASEKNPHAQGELTPRALELGYKPAFKFVMTSLASNAGKPRYSMNPHALALRFTDQTGSATEILRWYKSNQHSIRFDGDSKLFVTR